MNSNQKVRSVLKTVVSNLKLFMRINDIHNDTIERFKLKKTNRDHFIAKLEHFQINTFRISCSIFTLLGQTKVTQFNLTRRIKQDVGRLDVSMKNAVFLEELQRFNHAERHRVE